MRTIISAHVKPERTLTAVFEEINQRKTNFTADCNAIVHEDLINAFSLMVPHVIVICGFLNEPDKFTTTGIKLHIKEKETGITMTGYRKEGKRVFNFNVPYTRIDNGEYTDEVELCKVIDGIKKEVEEYLFNNKWTVKQPELPLVEEDNKQPALPG